MYTANLLRRIVVTRIYVLLNNFKQDSDLTRMPREEYWGTISWALCHMGALQAFMDAQQHKMDGPLAPMQMLDSILLDWWHATIPVTAALVHHPRYSLNIGVNLLLEIVSMSIIEAFEVYRADPMPEHTTAWRFIMRHLARSHGIRTGMRPQNITKWSNGWVTMDFTADAHWSPRDNTRVDFQWVNDL